MHCDDARIYFADNLEWTYAGAMPLLVAGHLEECESCRDEFDSLRFMWRDMELISPEEPPHEAMRDWLDTTVAAFRQDREIRGWTVSFRRRTVQVMFAMGLLAACVYAAQQSGLILAVRERLSPQVNSATNIPVANPNGTIEGVVVMRGSSTPIAGAQVALLEGGDHRADAVTNAQGHFTFGNVTPGNYEVHAFGDGLFGNPNEKAALPDFASVPVKVVSRQPVAPLRVPVIRGGSIGGRALDANGQPIGRASMSLYQAQYSDGLRSFRKVQTSAADLNGTYRFNLLSPGEYYVSIGNGASPCFYPGTFDPRLAKPVALHQVGNLTNVNVTYPNWNGVTISGRVIYAPGASAIYPVDNFNLSPPMDVVRTGGVVFSEGTVIVRIGLGASGHANMAADQSMGQFEIQGVMPGAWDLLPVIGNPDMNRVSGGVRLDVRDRDIRDVEITVGHPAIVNGKISVRSDGDSKLSDLLKLSVRGMDNSAPSEWLIPRGDILNSSFTVLSSTITKQVDPVSGEFTANVLPGRRYKLTASGLPPNAYVADILQAGKSVFDGGFLPESEGSNGLEVILDTRGATLKGTVETADQKPAGMGVVALIPATRQNMTLYKSAILRSDSVLKDAGQFSITGIAPGEYKVFAWEHVPPDAWKDADFISRYEARGKLIQIGQSGTSIVRVPLIPWEP